MAAAADGGGAAYVALNGGDAENGAENHDKALERIEQTVDELRSCTWWLSVGAWVLVGLLLCLGGCAAAPAPLQPSIRRHALLASIPIVALFFTWFHIWLAIQMMFRPLDFFGVWQYRKTGVGIGWQGVVPRKSLKMAKIAYSRARPFLQTPKMWMDRVKPDMLIEEIKLPLTRVVEASLASVLQRHYPGMHERMPRESQDELVKFAVGNIKELNREFWSELKDILCREDGIDNDGMVVNVFQQKKELLNHFFMQIGAPEFKFIEHCGAALGFVCGVGQLFLYSHLDERGRNILLPTTGFFLGIFTNWLAIQMCFRPVFPVPFPTRSCHLCTLQGLFLKRQKDVSVLYSKLLTDHFFEFSKVMAYLQAQQSLWDRLQDAYFRHSSRVFDKSLGRVARWLGPVAVGQRQFSQLQDDMTREMAARLAEASDIQVKASRYILRATDVFRSNATAMQGMPADKFEDLLHPVFQEDEWILVLLGGVLGAVVGMGQVWTLGS